MKASNLCAALLALCFVSSVHAGKEIDRLLSEYGKIETATCKIRRTKEGAAGKIKFLSRVYFTNQNKIHAEKLTPVKQRTIADGTTLYQYTDGSNNKGFSRPISELSEQMQISLHLVPGTAMDHLLRLKGLEETVLEPTEGAAKRVGIQAESKYVVLRFDQMDRLVGIDFFETKAMAAKLATYEYSDFSEVIPGTWIPFTHRATVYGDGREFSEVMKVDSFVANKPIAESLFIPASFFDKNIDFVDDFAKIFPD